MALAGDHSALVQAGMAQGADGQGQPGASGAAGVQLGGSLPAAHELASAEQGGALAGEPHGGIMDTGMGIGTLAGTSNLHELVNGSSEQAHRPAGAEHTDGAQQGQVKQEQEYLYLSYNFVHQRLRTHTPPCPAEVQLEQDGVMQPEVYSGQLAYSTAKGYYHLHGAPREVLLHKEIYGIRVKGDTRIVLQIKDRARPLATDEGRRRLTPRVIGITTSIRVDFLKNCFEELQEPRHPVNIKVEINGVRQPELFTGASISHNRQGSFYVLGLPFALVYGREFVAWRQLDSDTLELAVQDVDPGLQAACANASGKSSDKGSGEKGHSGHVSGHARKAGNMGGIMVDSRISIPLAMLKRDLGASLPQLVPGGLGPSFEIPISVQYRVDGTLLPRVYDNAIIKKSEHRGCCYLNGTERIPVKSKVLCGLEMQETGDLVVLDFKSVGADDVHRRSSPSVPSALNRPPILANPPTTAAPGASPLAGVGVDQLLHQISTGAMPPGVAAELAAAFAAAGEAAAANSGQPPITPRIAGGTPRQPSRLQRASGSAKKQASGRGHGSGGTARRGKGKRVASSEDDDATLTETDSEGPAEEADEQQGATKESSGLLVDTPLSMPLGTDYLATMPLMPSLLTGTLPLAMPLPLGLPGVPPAALPTPALQTSMPTSRKGKASRSPPHSQGWEQGGDGAIDKGLMAAAAAALQQGQARSESNGGSTGPPEQAPSEGADLLACILGQGVPRRRRTGPPGDAVAAAGGGFALPGMLPGSSHAQLLQVQQQEAAVALEEVATSEPQPAGLEQAAHHAGERQVQATGAAADHAQGAPGEQLGLRWSSKKKRTPARPQQALPLAAAGTEQAQQHGAGQRQRHTGSAGGSGRALLSGGPAEDPTGWLHKPSSTLPSAGAVVTGAAGEGRASEDGSRGAVEKLAAVAAAAAKGAGPAGRPQRQKRPAASSESTESEGEEEEEEEGGGYGAGQEGLLPPMLMGGLGMAAAMGMPGMAMGMAPMGGMGYDPLLMQQMWMQQQMALQQQQQQAAAGLAVPMGRRSGKGRSKAGGRLPNMGDVMDPGMGYLGAPGGMPHPAMFGPIMGQYPMPMHMLQPGAAMQPTPRSGSKRSRGQGRKGSKGQVYSEEEVVGGASEEEQEGEEGEAEEESTGKASKRARGGAAAKRSRRS